jgi:Ca2+-binding EF-hand superfamily protein
VFLLTYISLFLLSGSISLKELEAAMRARGLDPSAADVQEQIAAIDKDRNGKIDYSEFEAQMLSIVTAQVVAAEKQAAKDAFQQKLTAVYEKLVAHKSGKFDSKSLDEELKAQNMQLCYAGFVHLQVSAGSACTAR